MGHAAETDPVMEEIVDQVVALGELVFKFGGTDRVTYYPDGETSESDTDHTVMLAIIACSLASKCAPQLNVGRVAEFALAHDLPEVYAGDTPTLRITTAERQAKEEREAEAQGRISEEFQLLGWVPRMIEEYESLSSPEARFVKALDKLMPAISHVLNGGRQLHMSGVDRQELIEKIESQSQEMAPYAFDQDFVMELKKVLAGRAVEASFPRED